MRIERKDAWGIPQHLCAAPSTATTQSAWWLPPNGPTAGASLRNARWKKKKKKCKVILAFTLLSTVQSILAPFLQLLHSGRVFQPTHRLPRSNKEEKSPAFPDNPTRQPVQSWPQSPFCSSFESKFCIWVAVSKNCLPIALSHRQKLNWELGASFILLLDKVIRSNYIPA